MQLHELLGEGQAQPRPLLSPGVVQADLTELLEDGRLVLGRDADPRVGDGDGEAAVGRRRAEANPAALGGELHRIGEEVHQDLLDFPLVRDDVAQPLVHGLGERDPVSHRPPPHQGQDIVQGGRQMEPPELQLEPSGLHLGQVEDVVDQGEEVPAGGQDVLQVLGLLLVHLPEHPLGQHLREAEDRVQRRPQLMGHVGEELGLVAAGGLELPALVRDLAEQAGVLDGERGLRGERLSSRTISGANSPGVLLADRQDADDLVLAAATGTPSSARCPASEERRRGGGSRRHPPTAMSGIWTGCRGSATRPVMPSPCGSAWPAERRQGSPPRARPRSGSREAETPPCLVVLVDGAAVGPRELVRPRDDGLRARCRGRVSS